MKLKPDVKLRRAWFETGAMAHPAKGHLGLWWEIIERHTSPGQWVLDPMAGIGSTLMAAMLGRNVICVELEPHFVEPMAAAWAKIRSVGPMLGYELGQAAIIRGDSRRLPLASADAIVTSPPYENRVFDHGKDQAGWEGFSERFGHYTRPVSAVVTSPPYEGTADALRHPGDVLETEKGFVLGYTRPVDAVITSPPFGEAEKRDKYPTQEGYISEVIGRSYRSGVHGPENIGNLRNDAYWEAMTTVYQECHRVLIPRGIMALVVKGYTRDKKYVDLPQQTADLIETLGFQVFDRWTRVVPLSFWRTLQKQKGNWDEALRYEHVIAAKRTNRGGT